jgi:hypothetical protein
MTDVLERGDIFFLYRPRVKEELAEGLEDVQRFLVIVRPERAGAFPADRRRPQAVPEPEEHERLWALVDQVASESGELRAELERGEYGTRTRGAHVRPEARPAGEGRYALVEHDGHTHLAYELELPRRSGEPQEEMRIERGGELSDRAGREGRVAIARREVSRCRGSRTTASATWSSTARSRRVT